jgi:hypothetical protein
LDEKQRFAWKAQLLRESLPGRCRGVDIPPYSGLGSFRPRFQGGLAISRTIRFLAALVAFISPVASAALYALIGLFFVLESSIFGHR